MAQLTALVAIADLGTFEAAARHLHVTPSAISQRIRALEAATGQVLVRRSTPCETTTAGQRLLAVARQTQLLLAEVGDVLPGRRGDARRPSRRRERRLPGHLVAPGAGGGGRLGRRRAAPPRRGPGLLPRPPAPRRGAGGGDQRADAGPGLPGGATGLVALPAGGRARLRGALADRSRLRLGGHADGGLQREGRAPARRAARPRRRRDRLSSTTCRRRPTSTKPSASASAGRRCRSPSCCPTSRPAGSSCSAAGEYADVELHWQRWRLDSPLLDRLTDAVRRAARAGLRR